MTVLLDGRYAVAETVAPQLDDSVLVPAHDELLDQPVLVIVLDPVEDSVERERLLRRTRAALRARERHVAPLVEAGSEGDQPYLVVPRSGYGRLVDVLPVPAAHVVPVALQVLDGVAALTRLGVRAAVPTPPRLRVADDGAIQVLPLEERGSAGPTYPPVEVRAVGDLLEFLLAQPSGGPEGPAGAELARLAARATGSTTPVIPDLQRLREELVAWQAGHVQAAQPPGSTAATGSPPAGPDPYGSPTTTSAASAPPAAAAETAATSPVPRVAATADTSPADGEPATGRRYVPLTSLLGGPDRGDSPDAGRQA